MMLPLPQRSAALAAVILLTGIACTPAVDPVTVLGGATMATSYTVRVADPVADREQLEHEIQARLDTIEALMSTYIDASDVSRFNASADTGWMPVDAATCEVVALALRVSEQTGGAFDITVGPLVDLWGFGPDGAINEPPAAEALAAARSRTGYAGIGTDCEQPAIRKDRAGLAIDLSAVAKGFAADAVADDLAASGIANFLVEVGGEMRIAGTKPGGEPWRVGIEAPVRERVDVFSALEVRDIAVATSGDYRNYFEKDGRFYSHTLDPRTGAPVTHSTGGVTVLAKTAGYADALATALLVLGAEHGLELAERENIAALFLTRSADGIASVASSAFEAHRRHAATTRETP